MTPASSFIATLDHPWRYLRREFRRWAPAAYPFALIALLPSIVTQWASGSMFDPTRPGALDFGALATVYGGTCVTVLVGVYAHLGAFVIAHRLEENGSCTFGEAAVGAASPRFLVLGGAMLLAEMIGSSCIFGGPLLAALFGFAPVAALAMPGQWFRCWGVALERALRRTSPRDAGMPGWKLAALTMTWYLLLQAVTQVALIPTFGWMIWNMVTSIGRNDPAAMLDMTPPIPITVLTALFSTALKPLCDMYLAAGTVLLWKDLTRLRTGSDLDTALALEPAPA